jgi:hypothetical protein
MYLSLNSNVNLNIKQLLLLISIIFVLFALYYRLVVNNYCIPLEKYKSLVKKYKIMAEKYQMKISEYEQLLETQNSIINEYSVMNNSSNREPAPTTTSGPKLTPKSMSDNENVDSQNFALFDPSINLSTLINKTGQNTTYMQPYGPSNLDNFFTV